jgi:hypothetical protein
VQFFDFAKNRLALGIFEKLRESKNRIVPGISKSGSFLVFPGQFQGQGLLYITV